MKNEWMIEKLIELGISEKEARIYSALLQRSELTAMEIQEIAHVPRTKVYEITHRMSLSNMCIEKSINGKKMYQAVEPRKFLHILKEKRERDILEKKKLSEEIEKIAMPEYESGAHSTSMSKAIEVIRDLPSIHERYISLLKNLKKEFLAYVKPPYVHQYDERKMAEQDNMIFEKIRKGMKARMLYEMPRKKIEWTYNYIRQCVNRGENARIADNVPAKMNIFDEHSVVLILADESTTPIQITMLVIENQPLARTQSLLFDHLWKHADDYRILESLVGKTTKGD